MLNNTTHVMTNAVNRDNKVEGKYIYREKKKKKTTETL